MPSPPDLRPGSAPPRETTGRRLRIALTAAVVVAVLAIVALLVVVRRDADTTSVNAPTSPPAATSDGAATTTAPTAASTVTPSPTPAPEPAVDTAPAVWPVESSTTRYADPVAAARGFATDFLGFRNPVVGRFMQGDNRSGEVPVRPRDTGPVTTVLVRQLEDGNWWVLGATADQIRLDTPAAGDLIASPVRLTGAAQAFEGHVTTSLREDGSVEPLASGYVTGRMDQMGPFEGELTFVRAPSQVYGALLLTVESAENGELWQAAVIRVRLLR